MNSEEYINSLIIKNLKSENKEEISELILCLMMMIKDKTNLSYRNVIENAIKITDIFDNIIFDNDWNNNFLGSFWIDFIADHTNYWSKMLINEYKDSNNDCHPKSFYERRFPLLQKLYESIFRIYEKLEIRDNLTRNSLYKEAYKLNEELKNLCIKKE